MISSTVPYTVPQEPGRWQSIALAVLVHAVLLAFLWIGINWVNNKPETIEAEVWSEKELLQAPPVQAPEPAPAVRETPREVKPAPVVVDPEIAIQQEKKRLKKEKEKRDALAVEKEKADKKLADEKKKVDDKKVADEKKKIDDKKVVDEKKKVDDKKKADEDKKDKLLAKTLRDDAMKGIANQTKNLSDGGAERSQGGKVDSSWAARVRAKIKSLTRVAVTSDNNDPVEFDVRLLPDGSVAGIQRIKSSGIQEFDDAVRRAIELAAPYPPDSSGKVPQRMPIIYRPKDQQP